MPITLNPGSGGEVLETVNRVGTDERTVWEHGSVPTFFALGPANNVVTGDTFHFVLYNNSSTAIVQIRKIVWVPVSPTSNVPGAVAPMTQRIRVSPTTAPSGGSVTIHSVDSADSLPSDITAHSVPTTAPAGGTTKDFLPWVAHPDRVEISSKTATTVQASFEFGGMAIYESNQLGLNVKPLTLRQNQCYELQQSTAPTVSTTFRVLCICTII